MQTLSYPEYIGASEANEFDKILDRIVNGLKYYEVQFLFGAGMSRLSGIPTGSDVLTKILQDFFPSDGELSPTPERIQDLATEFPFEATVQGYQKSLMNGRRDLTRFLTTTLINPDYLPSGAHHDFCSLCYSEGKFRIDCMFTTNFDDLLERAIGLERAVSITETNAREIRKERENGRLPVLHLHGMLTGEYQITEKDVFSDAYRILQSEFLNALISKDVFVFIGYSMNDPDFRRLYGTYRKNVETRGEEEKKTVIILPARDQFSYMLGRKIWDTRGATWIPIGAETFFARLLNRKKNKFDKEQREIIKQKYDLRDDDALNDLIAKTADVLRTSPANAFEFLGLVETRPGGVK
jgi:hypothetical protein